MGEREGRDEGLPIYRRMGEREGRDEGLPIVYNSGTPSGFRGKV